MRADLLQLAAQVLLQLLIIRLAECKAEVSECLELVGLND